MVLIFGKTIKIIPEPSKLHILHDFRKKQCDGDKTARDCLNLVLKNPDSCSEGTILNNDGINFH